MPRFTQGLLTLLALGLLGPTADAELAPSEVTTLIRQAMLHQPDIERTVLTRPLVARMRIENLSDIERFHKGEVHFLNFEPGAARDEYRKFRYRNDKLGRVAMQRLMIIRINAFDMVDEIVEQDIPEYRKRFGIRAEDRYGVTYPLQLAAMRLVERGEVDPALDLVADEVRRHDRFDSPYAAYRLPRQFLKVAVENGRGEQFRALQQAVLKGLDAAIAQRLQDDAAPIDARSELPGVIVGSLFDDQHLDTHEWTAEFLKLRAAIQEQPAT